jgi:hypothetical protein
MKYEKKFLIIGNINAISYKEIFNYIKENRIWLGVSSFNKGMYFEVPEFLSYQKIENEKKLVRVSSICWYTNLDNKKNNEKIILTKYYDPIKYPKYDNYNAIEVSKYKDIPMDYKGNMGVPITFLDKYNPEQFEIVGINARWDTSGLRTKIYDLNDLNVSSVIKVENKYKILYSRIIIKNLSPIEKSVLN